MGGRVCCVGAIPARPQWANSDWLLGWGGRASAGRRPAGRGENPAALFATWGRIQTRVNGIGFPSEA